MAHITSSGGPAHAVLPAPDVQHLLQPTWAEVTESRQQYETTARRLRRWQWWFAGMFTVYATLTGILLLRMFVGQ